MEFNEFIKAAAHVKPDSVQVSMLRDNPFYMFVHFGTNTFTDLEWGDGTASPSIFNPVGLDCEQWTMAAKSAGMKGIVLTAKHHDGFCLWQSKYTDYCIKNSPYKDGKGDIVKECAEACKKHGLKFGFYLSPWDRNSKYYGTDEYNVYYKNQLTELLTGYGEIFYVWFDGACGEGPNGKKQVYDFPGYIELIKKYQPQAAIFNDSGTIRWCGNEAGQTGYAQWNVVPSELCTMPEIQTGPGPFAGGLKGIYNTDINLGYLSNIIYSKGLVYAPAEVDMSIRDGWFWHKEQEPHSIERLELTYLNSVGNNSTFNLNCPPDRNGRLDERDVKRLAELGEVLKKYTFEPKFSAEFPKVTGARSETQPDYEINLGETFDIDNIELAETVTEGQRVEVFTLYIYDGEYCVFSKQFTTIGSRKIVTPHCKGNRIVLRIDSSRDIPDIEYIKIR